MSDINRPARKLKKEVSQKGRHQIGRLKIQEIKRHDQIEIELTEVRKRDDSFKIETERNLKDGQIPTARTQNDLNASTPSKKRKYIALTLIIGGALLLVGVILLAYFLWPKEKAMNANEELRPHYSEGVKYEFKHAFNVSESLKLKKENTANNDEASDAGFVMNVGVSVGKNDIEDGGNLELLIGLEPADDQLLDEDANTNEDTEDTLMLYKIVLDDAYKAIRISGMADSMGEESLRYLLTLVEQLTPHVRKEFNFESSRNLSESMDEDDLADIIKTNGDVTSRGVEIPNYAYNVDQLGHDVYTITASNDNLIYPSSVMQPNSGFGSPKYFSFEKVTIGQDRTLLEDEKSVQFIIGDQEDQGRNLNEDDITLKAQIYQVTQIKGILKLVHKEQLTDEQMKDLSDILQDQNVKTIEKSQIERLRLQPENHKGVGVGSQEQGELTEQPRNLLSLEEIKTRVTKHYPSDFSQTENNIYIYKKDIVNFKVLGYPIEGGVYAAAGYSYLFNPASFGGFTSLGAGAYVKSSIYTNDWSFFLTAGATARFQEDKVVFEIGQLVNGKYTELSYAKTLDNPWPQISSKIIEIFNKKSSLLTKFKELILQVKESTPGVAHLEVPQQFTDFGDQCVDIQTLVDEFLNDDENLHFTNCLDLLKAGVQDIIQQIDIFIQDSNAPQQIKDLAQEVKELAELIPPIIQRVKAVVSTFEGETKAIFKALSLPLEENISHLNEEKTLFSVCWPVWIINVCVDAKSKQEASSSVQVDVMQLKGEAGPKYEANLLVDGKVSAYIVRAGVRVKGTIASAYLGTEVKQKQSTDLAQSFKVGVDSCLKSTLNIKAVQTNIQIYYSYKSLTLKCKNWWCSFKTKWNDKTIADWPLLKESTKSFELINSC